MDFVRVAAREAESCLEWTGGQADGCVLGQMHHFNPRKQVQFQWVFLPHQLRATVYGDQQPHPPPLPESATMKDLGVDYFLLPPFRSRDYLLLLLWYQQHYEKHFCVHQEISWSVPNPSTLWVYFSLNLSGRVLFVMPAQFLELLNEFLGMRVYSFRVPNTSGRLSILLSAGTLVIRLRQRNDWFESENNPQTCMWMSALLRVLLWPSKFLEMAFLVLGNSHLQLWNVAPKLRIFRLAPYMHHAIKEDIHQRTKFFSWKAAYEACILTKSLLSKAGVLYIILTSLYCLS